MSENSSSAQDASAGRGRGRGRGNRGGLGKYLRAKGRRGGGRPAEFGNRLVLDGEKEEELDEEEAAERAAKYSRRRLGTNADRYEEPEPELGSDGEPIVEPEVDLSAFLEKQRISDSGPSIGPVDDVDVEDVDTSLAHIGTRTTSTKKGKTETIKWDEKYEDMSREKASAEAAWDLKARFKAKSEKLREKAIVGRKPKEETYTVSPALPLPDGSFPPPKTQMEEMEDFLDDLLG
ncbi:hypothetical protein H0H93_012236 [Arthromyces matolae]|nr:hypothetical protein H0H93_012236 [Arthromyces matolae]